MHLVDDEHLDADSFQKPQRRLLHLHDVGARILRRAQQREQFGIEAPLSGLADHFHGQYGRSLLPVPGSKPGGLSSRNRSMIMVLPMPLSP